MLTINPSVNCNNNSNTFKAKMSNKQIYNEMLKLTIKKDEKIIPKVQYGKKIKTFSKSVINKVHSMFNKLKPQNIQNNTGGFSLGLDDISIEQRSMLFFFSLISLPIILSGFFTDAQIKELKQGVKEENQAKADSIHNLYRNATISFTECIEGIKKLGNYNKGNNDANNKSKCKLQQ